MVSTEQDFNEKVFPVHTPSILHDELVGSGSMSPHRCLFPYAGQIALNCFLCRVTPKEHGVFPK